jgi:catechol 2,3-dioxygenase-like lactoylglutathione lyase family enzyme
MPQFTKVTPNLIVDDIDRSLRFYEQVLGFARGLHVPDAPPFVFASVTGGAVEIFLNDRAAVAKEHPDQAERMTPSAGNQMFIEMPSGIDDLWASVKDRAPIVMPILTQWYGMREFAIGDPDGYVIVFAQRVES